MTTHEIDTHDLDQVLDQDIIHGLGEQGAFASAVDTERFGEYRITQQRTIRGRCMLRGPYLERRLDTIKHRARHRITSSSGWFCPWDHNG